AFPGEVTTNSLERVGRDIRDVEFIPEASGKAYRPWCSAATQGDAHGAGRWGIPSEQRESLDQRRLAVATRGIRNAEPLVLLAVAAESQPGDHSPGSEAGGGRDH